MSQPKKTSETNTSQVERISLKPYDNLVSKFSPILCLATCWYCERDILGFRYKIAGNDCDIECANNQINRSLEFLGRLLGEIPEFVGFGLGYDKPEFFWYIFAKTEEAVAIIQEACSNALIGFSIYPLMASIPGRLAPEPTVAFPAFSEHIEALHALSSHVMLIGSLISFISILRQ